MTISCEFKAVLAGHGHKVAAFPLYQIWLLGKRSLNGSGVLGCKLEWNVPGKSPLSLCLFTSFVEGGGGRFKIVLYGKSASYKRAAEKDRDPCKNYLSLLNVKV